MHASHAVSPSSSWCSPASHGVHVSAPALGLTVPGAHGVATAEPTGQKVPFGHVMHWSSLVITSRLAFWRVPPGHGSGAAEPSTQ